MRSFIKFPFRLILSLLRILFVGLFSGLFCVYTVDYLTSSSFGTFNLVIIAVYFTLVCIMAVLFVEIFTFLQRKSKKTTAIKKDKEKYDLK
ncbi:hypothetical protein AAGG74_18795 [Bacillus mexicanus]|uniref:hypothetical protein n=1 Tax=Bacillus mexicanus TaxID=2834415 RepID=UPI003D230430